MKSEQEKQAYEFIARAMLAEASLDRVRIPDEEIHGDFDLDVAKSVSLDLFDDDLLKSSKRMAAVYTAIACFENSARSLIIAVLSDAFGKSWWETKVIANIKKTASDRKEVDDGVKWHTQRGGHPIYYTDMGQLISIVSNNWDQFEPYFKIREWFPSIVRVVEKSRNIIMHSGEIGDDDIFRLGSFFKDWIRQVGA